MLVEAEEYLVNLSTPFSMNISSRDKIMLALIELIQKWVIKENLWEPVLFFQLFACSSDANKHFNQSISELGNLQGEFAFYKASVIIKITAVCSLSTVSHLSCVTGDLNHTFFKAEKGKYCIGHFQNSKTRKL